MRRLVLIAAVLMTCITAMAASTDPPAVMLDLGPVVATPAPTPEAATRKRLITTLTVQNAAGSDSQVSFECTDVAEQDKGKYRTLAAARYSLSDDSPKLKEVHARIISKIRDLERDLLDFAKIAGPPKDRQSVFGSGSSGDGEKQNKK
jgi:hypothetical protein